MEFVSFISVSTVEYIGILCAMLAAYRFEIKPYAAQIIVTAIFSSFLSHALRIKYELSMAPVFQLLILIILFCLIFRVQIIYSGIMVVTFSVVYIAVQTLTLLILPFIIPWFTTSNLQHIDSIQTYAFQMICSIINFSLATLFSAKKIGFTFVPTSSDSPYTWKKANRHLFTAVIFIFFALSFTYYLYNTEHFHLLMTIFLILACLSAIIFHYSRVKEYDYDR